MKSYRDFTEAELKWLRSLERVMKKAPDTLFMFVGNGMQIFTKDELNDRYMTKQGYVDQYTNCYEITSRIEMDGGDY